jgi:uncharacterized membrane protein
MSIRSIFYLDAIGAMVSAISLLLVIPRFNEFFGIPELVLLGLGIIPCIFLTFDYFVLLVKNGQNSFNLKIIAYANLLYAILSLVLAILHWDQLKPLGWTYLLLEILILILLVRFELKVANQSNELTEE